MEDIERWKDDGESSPSPAGRQVDFSWEIAPWEDTAAAGIQNDRSSDYD
jgi:hypothetical protein